VAVSPFGAGFVVSETWVESFPGPDGEEDIGRKLESAGTNFSHPYTVIKIGKINAISGVVFIIWRFYKGYCLQNTTNTLSLQ